MPQTKSRGTARGGIQKRRSPNVKTDRDGDLVMGAMDSGDKSGGRSGRGRSSSTRGAGTGSGHRDLNSQRIQQNVMRALGTDQANVLESRVSRGRAERRFVKVRIHGLKQSTAASNPDGGFRDLISFLDRKATGIDPRIKGLRLKKSHEDGDAVVVSLGVDEANVLLKLDQAKFAGTNLAIRMFKGTSPRPAKGLSPDALQVQERLRGVLSNRYDMATKVLNLSALGKDETLQAMGMFDDSKRVTKLFPVLMAVCDRLFTTAQAKRDAIVGVTLVDNELDHISLVTSLAQTFPDLKNLDLSLNKIPNLKAMEGWRWRFRHLDNLIVSGNPLDAVPNYQDELIKWYPTLRILNGVQVRSDAEVANAAQVAAQLKKGVTPIPISGPDFRDMSQVGENFIRQFFQGYDTDRAGLAASFYDDESVHSLCVNVSAPRSDAAQTASWAPYIKHSRNLVKLTQLPARINREYHGVETIKSLWASLPATAHPNISTDFNHYMIDCHPISGLVDPTNRSPRGVDGLMIMVHGHFEEKDLATGQTCMRSFSRTFVLGPGKPGQHAIRVLNDALILRAWGPVPQPGSEMPNQGPTPPSAGTMAAPADPEQALQQAVLEQLVQRTRMTPEYAAMCLAETGWNAEQAYMAFEANKDKLPPNAFMA